MDTRKILLEIERQISALQSAASALRGLSSNGVGTGRRTGRKLSAAARKRIGDAQRKRWAKFKQGKAK
jgi:hypothetical protein